MQFCVAPDPLLSNRSEKEFAYDKLPYFTKICEGAKVTVASSGIKICVSFSMPIRTYPQLVSIKSNAYALFSPKSYL
jgi:hypothetical protein